jgi:hypothetical protein
MTKYQVHDYWREHILPFVRAAYENDGVPDLPARRAEPFVPPYTSYNIEHPPEND